MEARRTLWVDVTTLVGWRGQPTGIARALGQIVRHWIADEQLPIRLCRYDAVHRSYYAVESSQLLATLAPASHSEPSLEGAWPASSWTLCPNELRDAVWHAGQSLKSMGRISRSAWNKVLGSARRTTARLRRPLPGLQFCPGDVLFLGGASWKDSPRPEMIQQLHNGGVQIASVVYDITPLRCPHLCAPDLSRAMANWLPGVLTTSDLLVTISEHSRRDLQQYGQQLALALPPIQLIRLGDEPGQDDGETAPQELISRAPGPFVLYVSTLGLNKNHSLLFHVWRRLLDRHGSGIPTLVLVGGHGWRADQLKRELYSDLSLSRHVRHLSRTTDQQLRWLYRRCLFTVYPSHYEGWGLPVAESLVAGKYCICSNAASLPEVGGTLVDYHDPLDGWTAFRLIEKSLLEPNWLASREERIRQEYATTTWLTCAQQTFRILNQAFGITTSLNHSRKVA